MIRERMVPLGGLVFVVAAALMLATIIARAPYTHGNLWRWLPSDYARTPVSVIGEVDLEAIVAELPPFEFPAPSGAQQAQKTGNSTGGGHGEMGGMAAPVDSGPAEVQKVTLTQKEFGFTPDRLTLKVGVPVELTLKNEGEQVHGLWIPEFGISDEVRKGRSEVFKFTPEKPGRIRYVCSYNLCGTEEEHARMVGFVTVR